MLPSLIVQSLSLIQGQARLPYDPFLNTLDGRVSISPLTSIKLYLKINFSSSSLAKRCFFMKGEREKKKKDKKKTL